MLGTGLRCSLISSALALALVGVVACGDEPGTLFPEEKVETTGEPCDLSSSAVASCGCNDGSSGTRRCHEGEWTPCDCSKPLTSPGQ